MLPRLLLGGIAIIAVLALAQAQTPAEHEAHHPAAVSDAADPEPVVQDTYAEEDSAQRPMQEMMARTLNPPKEFYPTLISLPVVSDEQRLGLERAAHERMRSGVEQMGTALARLSGAGAGGELEGMQRAAGEIREAIGRYDSGLAAARALQEGASPAMVATDWFKTEMNLSTSAPEHASTGPFGWPWSHFTGLTLLALFALVTQALNIWRVNRTTQILARMAADPAVAKPATAAGSSASDARPVRSRINAVDITKTPSPSLSNIWNGELAITQIFQETPEIKTFRLAAIDGGALPFRPKPGQYLCVFVRPGAELVRRCYTISSPPTRADYIELTVKHEQNGVASSFMHTRLQAGDRLVVEGPKGYFSFTGSEADSIVLISGGVGITPMMGIIRYLTDRGWPGDIFLLHCARSTTEFCFRDELEFLQRRHRNLHIVASMTRAEGAPWMGPRGRLTRDLIEECVPEIARRRVHLCGPPAMMDFVKGVLDQLNVPKEQIKTEAFGPVVSRGAVAEAQPLGAPVPAALNGTIVFARSGKSAPLPANKSILDVADEIGVKIDSACRSGTCGSCKIQLLKGAVTMAVEDALEEDEKRRGVILACQAKSAGVVEVDA